MQLSKPLTKPSIKRWMKWAAAANVVAAACALYAADPAIISIASPNLFPESITSTADGAIIIGSYGTSSVWRIPPGENNAAKWIDASSAKGALLGVLADEKSGLLLVCQAGVKTFDLKTGAAKEVLTIPTANPFCNDLAVRDDGTLYVTDTTGAKIFMFPKGKTTPFETTAVEVASDPLLAGADGLAFLSDPDKLYVNTVTTSKILRLDLAKDGKVTKITELKQSRPLQGPDGMRPIDGKRLIIAEGNGRTAMGVPDGDSIAITTLKEGGMEGGTPAVTVTKGMGWTMEGKLRQRDAKNPDADKGPFRLFPVPLPQ
ncbi:MAG: SMP-30/gluconolactonase/LRE family protein [Acidobacteriia bacterium]|nr:SMP-30/gluconolactonase/LRE family protein [Terriglobia bacterium]